MNGTQSPDAQKASNANANGSNSNNSSLAAKKRKKDLKPIITMEGTNQPAGKQIMVSGKIKHHSIHIAEMDTQQIWRGIASPYRSSKGRLKQVWTLLTVAVLELGPVCLGLDRRIRPHKPWAFTNLGSLDRSLGPLYLNLVCTGGGAVSHLPVTPLIVPEASVG
ncbi:hypothetical protein FGADI_9110 [Fusarium gaditjirri]|uniref:Uncharacterized protein n=1 Tax=Fusarium gaditjirri TaxID=282569 RepID=A0A8H4T0J2_9HYPO|nr:hypothetical protein FGADI_9110 [Fusarium gaditjirri]